MFMLRIKIFFLTFRATHLSISDSFVFFAFPVLVVHGQGDYSFSKQSFVCSTLLVLVQISGHPRKTKTQTKIDAMTVSVTMKCFVSMGILGLKISGYLSEVRD